MEKRGEILVQLSQELMILCFKACRAPSGIKRKNLRVVGEKK
jgi:hypothetical protein